MSIKNKKLALLIWLAFFTVLPLASPLLCMASYDKYMPTQETLPGGFQLIEMQMTEHKVYDATVLSGIWKLETIGYKYSLQNEPHGKNDREWLGWMNQQDMMAAVYIHVVIGEKSEMFDAYFNRFATTGAGFMPIPWDCAFEGGTPISLDVGEDQAVHLAFPPGYMFSKGDIGILVLSSPHDTWHWEKLALNTVDVDNILLAIAQSVGQSIPGESASAGIIGGGTSSDRKSANQIPSATILLATALSGLVLTGGALINVALNRPVVSANSPVPSTPSSPYIGEERNGLVWYKPPWDQGGPIWISKNEYIQIQTMTSQGKIWSDSWGWVDPQTLQQNEAARLNNRANFTSQDKTAAQITAAINKAKGGYNQALQNIINNQRRYDLEINQLKNLRQAGIEAKNVAKWEMLCKTTESISITADQTMNLAGKVIPGGGYISDGYTVLRKTAEGLGNAIAEGNNYTSNILKGTAEGVIDLAKDKAQENIFKALKKGR